MLGLEMLRKLQVKGITEVVLDLAINKQNMEHRNIKSFWLKKKIMDH